MDGSCGVSEIPDCWASPERLVTSPFAEVIVVGSKFPLFALSPIDLSLSPNAVTGATSFWSFGLAGVLNRDL